MSCCIYTSIAPKDIPKQRIAVDSWIDQGFSVISLNIDNEIKALQGHFKDIEFHPVDENQTGNKTFGKPLVLFDVLMEAMSTTPYDLAGVVNSDIIFRSNDSLPDYFTQHAAGSLVMGQRIDINKLQDQSGSFYPYGFDYFFLDRQLIAHYPQSGFCIGLPFWDYWIAVCLLVNKIPVKISRKPLAFHVRHDIAWDWEFYDQLGIHMMQLLQFQNIDFYKLARMPQEIRNISIHVLANAIQGWMFSQSVDIE